MKGAVGGPARTPKPRDVAPTTRKRFSRHSRLHRGAPPGAVPHPWRKSMARKNKKSLDSTYVLFDVVYEDGTQTSNRKVPSAELGGLDGDEPARGIIEAQDRKIAEMSGRPLGPIKSMRRSPNQ